MALTIKLNLTPEGFIKGLNRADKGLKGFSSRAKSRSQALNAPLAVATAQFGAIALAMRGLIKSAANMESVTTQFETLTGSVSVAKRTLQDLLEFSSTTPFQFEQVAKAGQVLLAFGIKAENVRTRLQQIGDVAAASGAPISDLARIFGQVSGAGKLTGERLNQLIEKGIAIGPAIKNALTDMGKGALASTKSIIELTAAGEITFEVFDKAFKSMSQEGGTAFEGMIKQSTTLNGLISTVKDNFSIFAIALGNEFLPQMKAVAIEVIGFLQKLIKDKALQENVVRVLKVVSVLAAFRLASLLGAKAVFVLGGSIAKLGFSALAGGLVNVVKGIKVFTGVMRGANLTINATKVAVKGLLSATGIGLFIAFLPEIMTVFKAFWTDAYATSKLFIDAIIGVLKGFGTVLTGVFTLDTDQIKQGFQDIKATIAKGVGDFDAVLAPKTEEEEVDDTPHKKAEQKLTEHQKALLAIEGEGQEARKKQIETLVAEARETALARDEKFTAEDYEKIKAKYELLNDAALAGMVARSALLKEEAEVAREERIISEYENADADLQRKLELESANLTEVALERRRFDLADKKQEAADTVRHGSVLAKIRAGLDNTRTREMSSNLGKLTYLQQSQNATAKGIGKAAAISKILIDAPAAATGAYKALAGIPLVGPALGVAAAAAALIFSKEQVARVRGAQLGGLVTQAPNTSAIGDTQPFLLEVGEKVTPKDDVLKDREANEKILEGRGSEVDVSIDIVGKASDIIQAEQVENRALGIGVT